ncbi:DUF1801 domain-containing protein [Ruegeria sp. HKCCD7559]|uniref:DUF1801 domain-containing protein n=1 Tax=Ruegeria sp. HKCCD7559 TaxID=2683005 RepID=UPI001490BF79|nr:DUF1801 domain-containing protein [Ruegeria sp. HKCCD7559]NOC46155.1 DUF1801 domain-containing protein [Ruegeria sp. HKCCD7559]
MARSDNKTVPTDQSVENFLKTVQPARRAEDAHQLDKLFRATTGFKPVMWGPSIVGYGRYHYRYKTGREGDFLATGFSPRKSALVIYIMPGYADFADLMARLGKHKLSKSCLYVNKLADIDTGVLRELIRAGLDDLDRVWPVKPF